MFIIKFLIGLMILSLSSFGLILILGVIANYYVHKNT